MLAEHAHFYVDENSFSSTLALSTDLSSASEDSNDDHNALFLFAKRSFLLALTSSVSAEHRTSRSDLYLAYANPRAPPQ